MSYLDLPRIHFGGHFQASPSTINNTPNNYNPANWNNATADPNQPTTGIELYWGPQGDGIFDLVECAVTSVIGDDAAEATDPLVSMPVAAVYTKAPPKLVDLDPMQQNTSEVWGLVLQIGDPGGPNVTGTFEAVSFNGIWANSQGPITPRNSQSGSGIYQSTVTNLRWNVGDSPVLQALHAQSPNRLSVRMVVNAHNNKPQVYLFNEATFDAMAAAGVPGDAIDSLQVLTTFRQMGGPGSECPTTNDEDCGAIPTAQYVNFQLKTLLGQQVAQEYGPTILECTAQPYVTEPYMGEPPRPYDTVMPTDFNHGLLVGTVGPAGDDDPLYVVPARTLAPPQAPKPQPPEPPKWLSPCYFTAAKLHRSAGVLTLDFANAMPVELPGRPPWADKLGTLSLAYASPPGSTSYTTLVDDIPYDAASGLMTTRAGMLDITGLTTDQVNAVASSPLVLLGTPGGKPQTVMLQENAEGISMRADQFVFRMNTAEQTTPTYPRGRTADLAIYVRKFGEVEGTEGLIVALQLQGEKWAEVYTAGTLGTSGTKGLENLSIPQDALQFSAPSAAVEAGVARFTLTGSDPGNPRQYVDGQVYFVTYAVDPAIPDYVGDPDDLVSVQIYHDFSVENPTWDTGIGDVLQQFGRLYPIMSGIGLSDHATVKKNAAMIRYVLTLDMADPLHMPATRDLSASRRNAIVNWLDTGAP